MIDEGTHATSASPSPVRPTPLAIDAAPRGGSTNGPKRSRLLVWIVLGIAAVLIVACGAAYLFARWVGEGLAGVGPVLPASSQESAARSSLAVEASTWWSGNGAYVVMQATGSNGMPTVKVTDLATGDDRTLSGYRVVGVEPHAPRIWLVPDRTRSDVSAGGASATAPVADIAWDGGDAPPSELLMLRLDSDDDPRSDVDARWAAWDGPAGYTVSVEIDVNKGACASMLRFDRTRSNLNAWPVKVPTDVATFEPIGWSPSGRYFAVITQSAEPTRTHLADAYTKRLADASKELGAVLPEHPRYMAALLIFDAADGRLVARDDVTVPLFDADSGPAVAAWGGPGDLLYHIDLENDFPALDVLTVDGEETYAESPDAPWADRTGSAWIAGVDGGVPLVALAGTVETPDAGTDIYRAVSRDEVTHQGLLRGNIAARWSPAGRMLTLASSWPRWDVYVSDIHGGSRAPVMSVDGPDIGTGD